MNLLRFSKIAFIPLSFFVASCSHFEKSETEEANWVNLLDPELSQWEVWTGKVESSVVAEASELMGVDGWDKNEPIGLRDPFGTYSVSEGENGELEMSVVGKVHAGITTLESYSSYHLTMEFKWGEKKWEPRLEKKRDSGILYHCYGEHGAAWDIWKRSLELQIQEGDFGDLYQLIGPSSNTSRSEEGVWDPAEVSSSHDWRVIRSLDMESPPGEWTRIDLYVIEDIAVHVVNGEVVMALNEAKDHEGNPLVSGQIQLQSEGADCYYRDIRIRSIDGLPLTIKEASGL